MADTLLHLWTVMYTVFLALFLFGITVFVHEFGHFIVARKLGLVAQTFSIGFGKAIWQWKKDGVVYKIGWIPFGGYVALPQLDPAGMEKIQGDASAETYPDVSPWKKIAVAVAGPLGNILLALILAWAIFLGSNQPILEEETATIGMVDERSEAYQLGIRSGDTVVAVNGKPIHAWVDFAVESLLGETENKVELTLLSSNTTKTIQVEIDDIEHTGQIIKGVDPAIPCLLGAVTQGSAADKAGLKANDIIVEFAGIPVGDWFHFVELVQQSPQEEVPVIVERNGQRTRFLITPVYNEEYERVMIGVGLGSFRARPMAQLKSDSSMIVRVLKGLITPRESGKVAKNLQGPVGIFGMLIAAVKEGLWSTLALIRLININLALLNLLPIPVLDGGHIVFSLWHGITRRKVNANVQTVLIQICAFLLIGAMLLITFNDIDRRLGIKTFFSRLIPAQTKLK